MRKEEDELISSLKEKKESDWTDKEKGRINKITKNRMNNRRRTRRRQFLDKKNEFKTMGSGETTRLLLGISLEEWSEYLFKDFKERFPDEKHVSLIHLLTHTDVQVDEINSCNASSLDIKSQLVLWNYRNSQLLFAIDNNNKGGNKMTDVFINNIYENK